MSQSLTAQDGRSATIAANVRAEVARAGRSQSEIATALGLSQTGVSRRLSGRVAFDGPELAALAALLDVPVAAFFGESAA